jgi:hypothetical protein
MVFGWDDLGATADVPVVLWKAIGSQRGSPVGNDRPPSPGLLSFPHLRRAEDMASRFAPMLREPVGCRDTSTSRPDGGLICLAKVGQHMAMI